MTPMQQLGEVLKSPLPMRGLPMRVASYTAIESGALEGARRHHRRSRRSRDARRPTGRSASSCSTRTTRSSSIAAACRRWRRPARARESPRLLLTSVALDPGEYTLAHRRRRRRRARRQRASFDQRAAQSRDRTGSASSDLMLVPQPPVAGELPRPRPTTVIDSETVSAMLELTRRRSGAARQDEGHAADLRRRERQRARQRRSQAGRARQRARVCGADAARRAAAGRIRRARDHRAARPARDAADEAVHALAGRRHVGAAARSRRAARSRCAAGAGRRVEDPRAGAAVLGAHAS